MLLLSSARAVRAMACATHSLQSLFFQKEFFGELIVFWHLNMDLTIFFNVILIKRLEKTFSHFQDKNITVR